MAYYWLGARSRRCLPKPPARLYNYAQFVWMTQ